MSVSSETVVDERGVRKFNPLFYIAIVLSIAIIAVVVGRTYQQQQYLNRLKGISLHNAAIEYPELVPEILAFGRDINELDSNLNTALQVAAYSEKLEAVTLLLEVGADPNFVSGDTLNPTALFSATFSPDDLNSIEITNSLLDAGADPNAKGEFGHTPLIRAARAGYVGVVAYEITKALIDAGADVNIEGILGSTALQYAVASGNAKIVDLLLTNGADPEHRNHQGLRAIDHLNTKNEKNQKEIQAVFKHHGYDHERRPKLFEQYRVEK